MTGTGPNRPAPPEGDWMAAMRRGDFRTAWCIADAVLAARAPSTRDDPARPYHERWVWDGRALAGRDVVVRCYHGLGDTLQFARFLPALGALAGSVTLEVQPELAGLLAQVPGVDRIVPFQPAAPIKAGCDIEVMELQHALRLPPPPAPYLAAAPSHAGVLFGACWRGGDWDPARSVSFAALAAVLPAGTISLQRGDDRLPDPLHGAMDVAATAGLVAGLAQVVSVDTMVAHLAGALGRPVHVLLRHEADWRWGLAAITPWYGSARLYRQAAPGDWSAPLAMLRQALG